MQSIGRENEQGFLKTRVEARPEKLRSNVLVSGQQFFHIVVLYLWLPTALQYKDVGALIPHLKYALHETDSSLQIH